MEKRYETVFILTPVLSDDQAKEAAKKIKKTITDLGAKVIHEENWGLKKLAYPIQKKTTGFYHLIEFTTENINAVNDLEVTFKRDERILRFLTVSLDKYAIEYSEKRKNKLKGESGDKKGKKEKADA
jgi:small subunit ribosomal protein S6